MIKIRIADIKYNDIVDGEGVCLSVWFQGCPHRCPGCHNPETWNFYGGYDIEEQELYKKVLNNINANGILRNLSLLGGEPMCEENVTVAVRLLAIVKKEFPSVQTFVWTGYTIEELKNMYGGCVFENIDTLIEGRFILTERDITLKLRGSYNQKILLKGIDF